MSASGSQLKITATGTYYCPVDDDSLPELKEAVRAATGVAVRRVTRFVQLALIGAGRCASGQDLPADTAVYFASCRGDTQVTVELLEDMVGRRELPGPLTFVNSVSNAACFHVARALGLHDRSNFITNRFDPITAALKCAWLDVLRGEVRSALVGSVDSCSTPLSDHRQRTQRPPDATVAEASHWLLLGNAADPRPALAWVRAVKNFSNWEGLHQWLRAGDFRAAELAPGQHLQPVDQERILRTTGIDQVWRYRQELAGYDSATGAAIEGFIARGARSMLHVNSDPAGRFSVVWLAAP
ncbi:beta-ketoacyl synthase chain length factor [Gilvimarinus sp. F26214L]|uniref:beta-ketoacyl synthase chain length factor n=1 Tax=Gilvimarinus sp. DZF01 TaxID=3461371 RepID=UPI0040464553